MRGKSYDHATKDLILVNVLEVVSQQTGVPQSDILSRKRNQTTADARHIVCRILSEEFFFSSVEIADRLERDHSTVLSSLQRAKELMEMDRNFCRSYDATYARVQEYRNALNLFLAQNEHNTNRAKVYRFDNSGERFVTIPESLFVELVEKIRKIGKAMEDHGHSVTSLLLKLSEVDHAVSTASREDANLSQGQYASVSDHG